VSRSLRLSGYIAIGIATGLLLASLVIFMFTRTDWGMERARRFVVSWLEDRVEGELRLSRITGPGLMGGVIIHDFEIVDPRGRPFIRMDSLELAYDWRTLLAGRIVLNRVVLHQPVAIIERLHGDTLWNYQHVFPADATPEDPDRRSLIMFNDARVLNGVAVIRLPFEPEGPIEPADTARLLLESAPGGTLRTMRFEDINARFDRVIWESPIEKGRLFDIASLQARGFVWRDPFIIRNARGSLTTRDSIVAFDLPDVMLPGSQASILGTIVMRTGDNDLDIRVEGRSLQFRDLQWLYPNMPEEGGGSLVLRIRSQPDGILWLAEDARLQAPGTRVAGSFGVVTGDTLYFTRVDLRASPLDVEFLEQLLPGGLPVDGLLIGTVEVRGPLSALETSGDLQLAGGGRGSGSQLAWRGVLDVRDPQRIAARSMSADVARLELALLTALNPELNLSGSVSGRVRGSGSADRLSFTAALQHVSAGGERSSLDAGGTVAGQGSARRFDVTVQALPVTLEDLAAQLPALPDLRGELRGPVRVEGTATDFVFAAELSTPGGDLALSGRSEGSGSARRIRADAWAQGFRLGALLDGLPETTVSGTLGFDITGSDVARSRGAVELRLDSAVVRGVPVGRVLAGGRLADGVFTIDSAALSVAAGTARASGSMGLVESRSGRIDIQFLRESVPPLDERLFGITAAVDPRHLLGRLDAQGSATGWIGGLQLQARLHGDELVYGATTIGRLAAQLTGRTERDPATGSLLVSGFRLDATADSLTVLGYRLQTARLGADQSGDTITAAVDAFHRGKQRLLARGSVTRSAGGAAAVRLGELNVGGASAWRLRSPMTVVVQDRIAHLDLLDLERAAGGRAVASGQLAWAVPDAAVGAPLDFRVALTRVPFSEVLAGLQSRADGAGTVDATLRVRGSALDPLIEAELSAVDLVYGDVMIDQGFAELSYAGLGLDLHAEAQHGGRSILTGGGRIPLDLRMAAVPERRLDLPLRFTITADSLPPALPLGLLDGFSNVRGRIDGSIVLGGTTVDPAMSGGFTLRSAAADWDVSGVRYSDVNGTFTIQRDRILQIDVQAHAADPRRGGRRVPGLTSSGTAGGSGGVSGSLDLSDLTDPRFDLRFTAERAYAAKRRDVEASVSGVVQLGGRYSRPEIGGTLRVDQGNLYIDEMYRQYLIVGLELDDPGLLSLVDTSLVAVRPLLAVANNPFLRNLQIRNMQVAVTNEAWLRSRDMDVEVRGDLNVTFDRRDEGLLRLVGSLNVERGTYTLYYPPLQSRRFQVRAGTIDFPGTPGMDPTLSITAAYRARANDEPLDILASVTGTLQNPRVRLTSDAQPPYSESDLASYLFFGVPTWEVASSGGPGSGDVRAVAGLGLGALRPSVLGYASSGLQTLVQSAGLLDYVGLTAADASPAGNTLLSGTQLELGRYMLDSRVFVGYSQRLGSPGHDPAVRIEWRFHPEFSLELFGEDRFARTPGFGVRSEAGLRKVYGFSLFREWGF
jgi:autotransporter translocation and assembly factor TamB